MTQHTTGPWTYSPDEDGQPILGPHGGRICDMDCVDLWEEAAGFDELPQSIIDENWEDLNAEREANARLIAAAPDLLAACEDALLAELATLPWGSALSVVLSAAINKAKGE